MPERHVSRSAGGIGTATDPSAASTYGFGAFTLDVFARRLWRGQMVNWTAGLGPATFPASTRGLLWPFGAASFEGTLALRRVP